ncbi:MAG: DinB family protein [Bryobacteraceae bacterium]
MIGPAFTSIATATLTQHATRIDACLAKLTPEQVWVRASENENAIGNLVLHLCGNLRQYTRHAILDETDTRVRDDEFNAQGGIDIDSLRERLKAVVADAAAIVKDLSDERLAEKITVQNREMTVLEAIFRTTEHFSQHTGQILYATKLLTHRELGFFTHKKASA